MAYPATSAAILEYVELQRTAWAMQDSGLEDTPEYARLVDRASAVWYDMLTAAERACLHIVWGELNEQDENEE